MNADENTHKNAIKNTGKNADKNAIKNAVKCIIVFGLESSGTRYVSRAVAKLQNPKSAWNGEFPECYHYKSTVFQHVSLPFYGTCNPHEKTPVLSYDVCEQKPHRRFIVNATEVMRRQSSCKAIVVTRSVWERRSSTEKQKHCVFRNKTLEEEYTSLKQLNLLLETFPTRTQLISYEWLTTHPKYVWQTLASFLSLNYNVSYENAYDANFKQLVALHKSNSVETFVRTWS